MARKKEKLEIPLIILSSVFIFLAIAFYVYKDYKKTHSVAAQTAEVKEEAKPQNIEDVAGLDLLGKAKISFAGGSVGRKNNIKLGLSRMNGKVIPKGKEFSFTETLGTTTAEDGFSVERIFLNGEVTKGLGGGLCQVSTVLFQTALSAGLPITERHNHTYSVSYYDVGLDATYSDPGPDLKFVNDTNNPIKILARTEGDNAVLEMYGKSDGRVSSTTEPEITKVSDFLPTRYIYVDKLEEGDSECVNRAQIGYTSEVKYDVNFPDGKTKEQVFTSRYSPLQRVCYVVGLEGLKQRMTEMNVKI